MRRKSIVILFSVLILILLLVLILRSCSNRDISFSKKDGNFSKTKSEVIIDKYKMKSSGGFFSSLDFDLKEGKVDWEIINPKGEVIFKGYVINENGITYRQLTYSLNVSDGDLNLKKEVKPRVDTTGKIINIPDFGYLQFQVGSHSGTYTLSLKPSNAEGKFTVIWSDGLLRK